MNHSGKAAWKRFSACGHVCVCAPVCESWFGSAPFQRDSCPLSKGCWWWRWRGWGGAGGEAVGVYIPTIAASLTHRDMSSTFSAAK